MYCTLPGLTFRPQTGRQLGGGELLAVVGVDLHREALGLEAGLEAGTLWALSSPGSKEFTTE